MDRRMNIFKKSGFSLTELMVIAAVVGVVTAIAAPNYMNYMADRRLKGAARMVMSDLMAARQKAVSQNYQFMVFFNTQTTYTILYDTNNNGTADTGETTEAKNIRNDYYDVTFSASGNPVFSPRGTAGATAVTVTLTSARTGASQCVMVAPTGRVKIDVCP
jgi:Tfp pilus assembly protein FimT